MIKTELESLREENAILKNENYHLRKRHEQYKSTPRCAELTRRADAFLYRKDIDYAFIQQKEGIGNFKVRHESGTTHGIQTLRRDTTFRVFARSSKGDFCDREGAELEAVLGEVLTTLGLPALAEEPAKKIERGADAGV